MATLRNLRGQVLQGYRARQYVTGTVASHAVNSTTAFYDANRQEPDGEWDRNDTYVLFTNGTNDGVVRRITGWSTNSTFTFAPAATAAVGSGAAYTLQKTFQPTDVTQAINEAMRDIFPERTIQSFATAAETADSYIVVVPSAAIAPQSKFIKVERSVGTTSSDWNYQELALGSEYDIVQSFPTVHIVTAHAGASGHLLRFHYQRPAGELTADTDTTDEPPHLIILAARKFLALAENDMAGVEKWGRELQDAKKEWQNAKTARPIRYPRIGV